MCTWVALSFEFKKRIRMNVRVRAYFIRQVAEVRGVEIDTWGRMSWWSSAVMRLNHCADCWRFAPCHRSETWNFVMVLQVPLLTKLQSKELFFVMNYFRTIFSPKTEIQQEILMPHIHQHTWGLQNHNQMKKFWKVKSSTRDLLSVESLHLPSLPNCQGFFQMIWWQSVRDIWRLNRIHRLFPF